MTSSVHGLNAERIIHLHYFVLLKGSQCLHSGENRIFSSSSFQTIDNKLSTKQALNEHCAKELYNVLKWASKRLTAKTKPSCILFQSPFQPNRLQFKLTINSFVSSVVLISRWHYFAIAKASQHRYLGLYRSKKKSE